MNERGRDGVRTAMMMVKGPRACMGRKKQVQSLLGGCASFTLYHSVLDWFIKVL